FLLGSGQRSATERQDSPSRSVRDISAGRVQLSPQKVGVLTGQLREAIVHIERQKQQASGALAPPPRAAALRQLGFEPSGEPAKRKPDRSVDRSELMYAQPPMPDLLAADDACGSSSV